MGGDSRRLVNRRKILAGGLAGGALLASPWTGRVLAQPATPVALADAMTIDVGAEPTTLDPANVYDADGWSVVHAIYDALVQYGPGGDLQPLLAESLTPLDPTTYEVKLRRGITFHNGEPFDAKSVSFSIAHIVDPNTKSQVAQNFAVIERVDEVDPFTVRLKLSAPAPWLPAQMAAWLAMLPPGYAADPANDVGANPVGTGPFKFAGWDRGSQIRLEANPSYFAGSPKGRPSAQRVTYRFVPEPSTRVADLLARSVDLVRGVPVDQVAAVQQDGEVLAQPISGSAWIRVPNDVAPFDDARVRQALNYAVDVDAVVAALLAGKGERLATFLVPGSLGFDPDLKPYGFDPDRARSLLADAGHAGGFETSLAFTTTERKDVVEAIAGQLVDVGVKVTLEPTELATFNATWTDRNAPPLRFATWRPLFDPYTLLSLVVAGKGFLSRYDNPTAETLLDAAASQADPDLRSKTYRELGRTLRDDPAAIYLYHLTSFYGLRKGAPPWTPRPDDYMLPTVVE